jgi:hypothetical protein
MLAPHLAPCHTAGTAGRLQVKIELATKDNWKVTDYMTLHNIACAVELAETAVCLQFDPNQHQG